MINPSQQSVLHLLAFHCLWNDQPRKAEPLYALLLAWAPQLARTRTGLACAQLHNGTPREALKSLAPLVNDPDPVVQLLLGKALLMVGDVASARLAMRQFRDHRPPWRKPVLLDIEEAAKANAGGKRHAR